MRNKAMSDLNKMNNNINKINNNSEIPLRIERLCNPWGCIDGGEEVTLLLNYGNISRKSLQVRVSEVGPSNETLWLHSVGQNIQIYRTAITFKMPKYGGKWPNDETMEIVCLIQVTRSSDDWVSNPVEYIYVNDELLTFSRQSLLKRRATEDELPRTLKNCRIELVASYSKSKEGHSACVRSVRSLREKLAGSTNVHAEQQSHGNTIFHDAIACDDSLKFYEILPSWYTEVSIRDAINDRGENLLHYACKLNKPSCITLLIHFGISTISQDISGRTPLHIALKHQSTECVEIFRQLFDKQIGYPHLAAELRRLLETYNAQGYTVLHLAVLSDLRELVDAMLKFSVAMEIDVCAIEALGSGDTILHLATYAGLNDMVKLITKRLPKAGHCANYAGYNAFGQTIN